MVLDESSSESVSESGGIVCTKKIRNVPTNYRNPTETNSSRASTTVETIPESSHDYSAVKPSVVERPVIGRSTREKKPPDIYGSWVYSQKIEVLYV